MPVIPGWVQRVISKSDPVPRFSIMRMWAQFQIKLHCSTNLHREVSITAGSNYWGGCSDCDFFPVPKTSTACGELDE
tara:strand:+ start:464 stop:694 length:231 start_codon:yes stop_codon:yes gene_type:complete